MIRKKEEMVSLGKGLRSYRKEKKLTLKEVAKSANISVSYLSEIERDITSPAIGTLKRITNVLDINIASLFNDYPMEEPNEEIMSEELLRMADRKKILYSSTSRITWYLLTQDIENKMMEPLLGVLEPGAVSDEVGSSHPEGEEFLFVKEGKIEIRVGEKSYILHKGDSIYYNATLPHRYINLEEGNSVILAISTPPGF